MQNDKTVNLLRECEIGEAEQIIVDYGGPELLVDNVHHAIFLSDLVTRLPASCVLKHF